MKRCFYMERVDDTTVGDLFLITSCITSCVIILHMVLLFNIYCHYFNTQCNYFNIMCHYFNTWCQYFNTLCHYFNIRCHYFNTHCHYFNTLCYYFNIMCHYLSTLFYDTHDVILTVMYYSSFVKV